MDSFSKTTARKRQTKMKCVKCFEGEPTIGVTSLTYERDGSDIQVHVTGIPAEICPVCGEVYLSEAVAQQIYELVSPLLETGEEMAEAALLPPPRMMIQFPLLEPVQLKRVVAVA
ncbi:MAG TPA: type II toxin-antitoxin system MqsA family antitoxin [Chloroflexota bacterium]|nr:type II toxin-antitoxin system MqsA family antitoxin [Chloroflexota bacterium]HUM71960.1 type II toxin-antitoxin system MqsA family antitoxin [Chloroflexota bacterium]